jgi:predicted regulator of amino acid metabolism with ACT domain
MMAITVDEPVPDKVIKDLLEIPGFADARTASL